MEPAGAIWTGAAVVGLGVNAGLQRRGARLLCQVARNRWGFLVFAGFGLHLFVPRLDPVHLFAEVWRWVAKPKSSPG